MPDQNQTPDGIVSMLSGALDHARAGRLDQAADLAERAVATQRPLPPSLPDSGERPRAADGTPLCFVCRRPQEEHEGGIVCAAPAQRPAGAPLLGWLGDELWAIARCEDDWLEFVATLNAHWPSSDGGEREARLTTALLLATCGEPGWWNWPDDLTVDDLEARGMVRTGRDQTGEGYCEPTQAGQEFVDAELERIAEAASSSPPAGGEAPPVAHATYQSVLDLLHRAWREAASPELTTAIERTLVDHGAILPNGRPAGGEGDDAPDWSGPLGDAAEHWQREAEAARARVVELEAERAAFDAEVARARELLGDAPVADESVEGIVAAVVAGQPPVSVSPDGEGEDAEPREDAHVTGREWDRAFEGGHDG